MNKANKLTIKENLFVERYLVHFNASRAVREAKYNVKGIKEYGCQLLTKRNIREAVEKGIKKVCERNEVNQNETVQDLIRMASSDMSDYVEVVRTEHKDENGEQLGITEKIVLRDWDGIDTAMIKEIRETSSGIHIKLYDRQRARETLARYHGILIENIKLDGRVQVKGFADLVRDVENAATKNNDSDNADLFS